MGETIAQHIGPIAAGLAALLALFVIGILIAKKRARRHHRAPPSVATLEPVEPPAPSAEPSRIVSAPTAAVRAPASKPVREPIAQPIAQPSSEAESYLMQANKSLADGDTTEAAELLRQCIRAAAAAPHKAIHAKARLVLGDIAHADGDAITACEHWQIARAIFHELNDKREHAEAETRMLSNGCPTDWVLTDF